MRLQNEAKENPSKPSEKSTNDKEEDNDAMTSTQNMIKAARERRQNVSKRIQCNNCEKRFNKDSTYKKHMRTVHSEEASANQHSNQVEVTLPNNDRTLRSYKKL